MDNLQLSMVIHARALCFLLIAVIGVPASARQIDRPECAAAEQCVQLTLDAMVRRDYEAAHTLAWRVVQLRPKNDPAAMTLLARTQSLSGRMDDAFVMLRRLTEAELTTLEGRHESH